MSREGKFDYQRQAEAAMKMAAATTGCERLKWVRVAQAWHGLARLAAAAAANGRSRQLS
jgi:4-aminobutyrate aminotransferase-like enzyme